MAEWIWTKQPSLAVLLSCLEAKLIVTEMTAWDCLISTHFCDIFTYYDNDTSVTEFFFWFSLQWVQLLLPPNHHRNVTHCWTTCLWRVWLCWGVLFSHIPHQGLAVSCHQGLFSTSLWLCSRSFYHDFMVNRHLTTCKRPLQLCWRWQALKMQIQTPFDVPFKANTKCCSLWKVSGPLVAMSFNEELELLHYPQSGTFPECGKHLARCYNKVKCGCKIAWPWQGFGIVWDVRSWVTLVQQINEILLCLNESGSAIRPFLAHR